MFSILTLNDLDLCKIISVTIILAFSRCDDVDECDRQTELQCIYTPRFAIA